MNRQLSPDVAKAFSRYPQNIQKRLYQLRELLFETASAIDAVGPVSETLKWGEPAYLTEESKSGSTIRIGWKKTSASQYAMYFNCRTTLVDTFRTLFPEMVFQGNRAIVFEEADELPKDSVSKCIELALTYHSKKKVRRSV